MGSTYELYKGLSGLQASKIIKKNVSPVNVFAGGLNDSDKVSVVLSDGEEVQFELESKDIWL
jgi:hypothetical protein